MQLSRILATGAAVALVGASSFALASTADAASADPTTNYVTASQFTTESSPYPAQWFEGDVAVGQGTIASGPAGLTVTGTEQLLNGATPTTGLVDLVQGASFIATGPAAFQISLFTNATGPDSGFTTLVPDDITPDALATTTWHTTQAITDSSGDPLYAAGATVPLSDFVAADPDYQILAYGVFVGAGFTTTLHSITWNEVTSQFTPAPTAAVTPATLTPADSADATKGVTGVFTGFIPGETIEFGLGTSNSGGPTGDTAVADPDGSVTYHFVSATALDLGTYTLTAIGGTSLQNVGASFQVVAPAPELASTGTDATPYLFAGGALLILGLGFGAVALRRRSLQRD